MPDNYRYLPSYAGDRETELAWRSNDTRCTQVDWDELVRRNRMPPDTRSMRWRTVPSDFATSR